MVDLSILGNMGKGAAEDRVTTNNTIISWFKLI